MTIRIRNQSCTAFLVTGVLASIFLAGPPDRSSGEETVPPLDQVLTQAMDRNPTVVTAKAKLAAGILLLRGAGRQHRVTVKRDLHALLIDQLIDPLVSRII